MKYNMKEIFETAIILFILRNILILINIIFSIKNIEILFFFLLLILDYFIWVKESQSKELLDKYILINFVLFSFYLCKEPLFFFSINKIVFLFLVSLIQILLIIFTYKIKINFSLKELLKVFIISGIVYYLPNILLRIFFKIIY